MNKPNPGETCELCGSHIPLPFPREEKDTMSTVIESLRLEVAELREKIPPEEPQ